MYICICRAINEQQVARAHQNGAQNPRQVFRHCGTKAQCKSCLPAMADKLTELDERKAPQS